MDDWREVYHRFDPKEPLQSGDPMLLKELYQNNFYEDVKENLISNMYKNYKLLFSGHTGCGKSTFLNLLSDDPDISEKFHVVKYSIKEISDENDIDHIDLLLSMLVMTLNSLSDGELKEAPELIKQAEALEKELKGMVLTEFKTETAHKFGLDAAGGVDAKGRLFNFLKFELFPRYRFEKDKRIIVRERYTRDISDFISLIDSMFLKVKTHLRKEPLILIDDSDKIPPEIGIKIFFDNGQHLAAPEVNVVFVLDVSLAMSSKYAAIKGKFSAEEFFPAVKVTEKDGSQSHSTGRNIDILKQLVYMRIPPEIKREDFISDNALTEVIKLSGGVVRELVRLLNHSIFNAKGKIEMDNVNVALYKVANSYNFYGQHTKIMKETLADPEWYTEGVKPEDEKVFLELLHMPAIFQYRNGATMKWYRPYPIFIDWLSKLKSKPALSEPK